MLNKGPPFLSFKASEAYNLPLSLFLALALALNLPPLVSHPLYFLSHLNICHDPRLYKDWTPCSTSLTMTHPKSRFPNGALVFVSDFVQGHPHPCTTMPVLALLPLGPRPTSYQLFKTKPEEKQGICPQ